MIDTAPILTDLSGIKFVSEAARAVEASLGGINETDFGGGSRRAGPSTAGGGGRRKKKGGERKGQQQDVVCGTAASLTSHFIL